MDYAVYENMLVIYSLKKSVLSEQEIKKVFKALQKATPHLSTEKILCRDSEKVFEEIRLDKKGHILGFYPLGERVLDSAINKVNRV